MSFAEFLVALRNVLVYLFSVKGADQMSECGKQFDQLDPLTPVCVRNVEEALDVFAGAVSLATGRSMGSVVYIVACDGSDSRSAMVSTHSTRKGAEDKAKQEKEEFDDDGQLYYYVSEVTVEA